MGLIFHSFTFAQGLPTFQRIKQQFEQQTGLTLGLEAIVHLPVLCPSEEVSLVLARDADRVNQLSQELKAFLQQHPGLYEEATLLRNEQLQQLRDLSHVNKLQFNIVNFYVVPIGIHENTLSFESATPGRYGIDSLRKTLFELGGRDETRRSDQDYDLAWHKLKRWEKYRWYNRPKK